MLPMIKMTQYYDTRFLVTIKLVKLYQRITMLPMIKMTQYYDTRFLVTIKLEQIVSEDYNVAYD